MCGPLRQIAFQYTVHYNTHQFVTGEAHETDHQPPDYGRTSLATPAASENICTRYNANLYNKIK